MQIVSSLLFPHVVPLPTSPLPSKRSRDQHQASTASSASTTASTTSFQRPHVPNDSSRNVEIILSSPIAKLTNKAFTSETAQPPSSQFYHGQTRGSEATKIERGHPQTSSSLPQPSSALGDDARRLPKGSKSPPRRKISSSHH